LGRNKKDAGAPHHGGGENKESLSLWGSTIKVWVPGAVYKVPHHTPLGVYV